MEEVEDLQKELIERLSIYGNSYQVVRNLDHGSRIHLFVLSTTELFSSACVDDVVRIANKYGKDYFIGHRFELGQRVVIQICD